MKRLDITVVITGHYAPFRPRLGAASLKHLACSDRVAAERAFRPRLGAASLKRQKMTPGLATTISAFRPRLGAASLKHRDR